VAHAIALPEVSEMIRVLAADSTRMNSQLLATALERDKRFQVLETAPDARSIVASVLKEKPAVVVISAELDGNPRRGFEVAREVRAAHGEIRIIMLLDTSERSQVVEAFRAGARGVFSRAESLKSLAKCICCVHEGQVWADSKELRYLLEALGEALPLRVIDARGTELLSRREQEVVRCVAEGLSNRVSKRVEVVLYAYSLSSAPEVVPSTSHSGNGKAKAFPPAATAATAGPRLSSATN